MRQPLPTCLHGAHHTCIDHVFVSDVLLPVVSSPALFSGSWKPHLGLEWLVSMRPRVHREYQLLVPKSLPDPSSILEGGVLPFSDDIRRSVAPRASVSAASCPRSLAVPSARVEKFWCATMGVPSKGHVGRGVARVTKRPLVCRMGCAIPSSSRVVRFWLDVLDALRLPYPSLRRRVLPLINFDEI